MFLFLPRELSSSSESENASDTTNKVAAYDKSTYHGL